MVKNKGLKSIAISSIHSYKNPIHEIKLEKALKGGPELSISTSHTIHCEIKEYERTCATALSAYLNPILKEYLESLRKSLPQTQVFIQQSNGGYTTIEGAKNRAIQTILSGPAGGA